MALITYQQDWETLRNWYSAKKLGFPMYRVTNDTFMDNIKAGGNVIYIIFFYLN